MDGWMDRDHSEVVERLSRPFLTYPLLHLPGSPYACVVSPSVLAPGRPVRFRWPRLDLVLCKLVFFLFCVIADVFVTA